jgi:hypothetical protein
MIMKYAKYTASSFAANIVADVIGVDAILAPLLPGLLGSLVKFSGVSFAGLYVADRFLM